MSKNVSREDNNNDFLKLLKMARETGDSRIIAFAAELAAKNPQAIWNTKADYLKRAIENYNKRKANARILVQNEHILEDLYDELTVRTTDEREAYPKKDIDSVLKRVAHILKKASVLYDISVVKPLRSLTFKDKKYDLQLIDDVDHSLLSVDKIYLSYLGFISVNKIENGNVFYEDLETGTEHMVDFITFKKECVPFSKWLESASYMPLPLESSTRLYRSKVGIIGELHIDSRGCFKWVKYFSKSIIYDRCDLDVFKDKKYVIIKLINQLQENFLKTLSNKRKSL